MAETLTVALRVAEEAIEEAIAKAEEFSDSLVRRYYFFFFYFVIFFFFLIFHTCFLCLPVGLLLGVFL